MEIVKQERDCLGQRSKRTQRLLDQYELQLEELKASATADELAAEKAAANTAMVEAFTRRPTWRAGPASSRSTPTRATTPLYARARAPITGALCWAYLWRLHVCKGHYSVRSALPEATPAMLSTVYFFQAVNMVGCMPCLTPSFLQGHIHELLLAGSSRLDRASPALNKDGVL